ncbi:hypothetical protein B0I35DRAFT_86808 [Stachybotrys elegans]|uniref:Uncharacterized protein n=1 Tax=Stachybotrys elegans TaxID=80388 RepID=A0A8K0WM82_9HYPO|nr:hypothetical protein B0I35DRAFT_86808 [Stachybotrys elegans]
MARDLAAIVYTDRIKLPKYRSPVKTPLSVLDATTQGRPPTSIIWFFKRPQNFQDADEAVERNIDCLKDSLAHTIREGYPQCCGFLKIVDRNPRSDPVPPTFLPHARRNGRIYYEYGTRDDPGVEVLVVKSTKSLVNLPPDGYPNKSSMWIRSEAMIRSFLPPTKLSSGVAMRGYNTTGPLMAVQVTKTACGGLVIAINSAHPLADTLSLACFASDWAENNRRLLCDMIPPTMKPHFDPSQLDTLASGDINVNESNADLVRQAASLPLSPYTAADTPTASAGISFPHRLDKSIASCSIYLTAAQVLSLCKEAAGNHLGRLIIGDIVSAHIWSCVDRARGLGSAKLPSRCEFEMDARAILGLSDDFAGSPTLRLAIQSPAATVSVEDKWTYKAPRLRAAFNAVFAPGGLGSHLHSLAFAERPPRLLESPIGVYSTALTWAPTALYEADFGFDSEVKYVGEWRRPSMAMWLSMKSLHPQGPLTWRLLCICPPTLCATCSRIRCSFLPLKNNCDHRGI